MKYLKDMKSINESVIKHENNHFRKIWGTLLKVKVNGKNLKDFYNDLLKEIYKSRGLYREETFEFLSGVYDTYLPFDSPRSHVNFLNTNYTAFGFFIDKINKDIYNGKYQNYKQFNFNENLYENLENLFNFLNEYKYEIFNDKSEILLELIKIVFFTKRKGEFAENLTMEKLSKFKGITNIEKSKEWGYKQDMLLGVDVRFTYNNKLKKIQVKSFEDIIIDDNNYIIKGVSNPKKYDNIDLFAFYNHENKYFYMFDNKDVIIEYDSVIINKKYKRNI